ncbi:hypothetical protein GCM10027040_29740 [Halomonas shantousis]
MESPGTPAESSSGTSSNPLSPRTGGFCVGRPSAFRPVPGGRRGARRKPGSCPEGASLTAQRLQRLDQAGHLVIGADRDAQEIAQARGVEVPDQNAAFAQAGKYLAGLDGIGVVADDVEYVTSISLYFS